MRSPARRGGLEKITGSMVFLQNGIFEGNSLYLKFTCGHRHVGAVQNNKR